MNALEYNMNHIVKYLNKSGKGFGWKNHPNRNYDGVYINGEVFDYVIFKETSVYLFDCKETNLDRWVIKEKDVKQAINLKQLAKLNISYDCFFLIYFKHMSLIRKLSIDKFCKILMNKKYVLFSECEKFELESFITND